MQSPAKLFRSLKHGDPQAVAFSAVTVFLISVCWFSWTFLNPPSSDALPLGGARRPDVKVKPEPSLSDVLMVQRVYLTPGDVPNPFYREPPKARRPREPKKEPQKVAKPAQKNGEKQVAAPSAPPPENVKTAPPPEVKPKTKPLTLTYHGMITRPDHNTVAMISIAEENRQSFSGEGEKIDPFIINEISPEGILIQQGEEPEIFLPRGKTQKFNVPL